jgi:hypothetical protein
MPDNQNSDIGFTFKKAVQDKQLETIARFLQLKNFENILPVPAQGEDIGFRDFAKRKDLGSVDRNHLGRIFAILEAKKTNPGAAFLLERVVAIKGTHVNKEVQNPDRTTLQVIRGGQFNKQEGETLIPALTAEG